MSFVLGWKTTMAIIIISYGVGWVVGFICCWTFLPELVEWQTGGRITKADILKEKQNENS